MLQFTEIREILNKTSFELNLRLKWLLIILMALGMLSFILGLISGYADYAWQALLVNTLFFAGLVHGCLMVSVIITITKARWGGPIKRLAEATALFIPVTWLLFGGLFFGMSYFFEWVDPSKIIVEKSWWLNLPLFIARNVFLLLTTGIIGLLYVFYSIKSDLILINREAPDWINKISLRILSDTTGSDGELQKSAARHLRLAPIFAILYAILTCLLAFDWTMSIDQGWVSTLFGVQYSISNILAASAFLLMASSITRWRFKLKDYLTPDRHNDLSRLVFAFSIFWAYLVFSQILVIWYANIPEEAPFLILRMKSAEWSGLFYFLCFTLVLIPFFGLLTRIACRSPLFSSIIAAAIFIGLWWEKYFLTIPSIQKNLAPSAAISGLRISIFDISITVGVLAAFVYCLIIVLRTIPMLPVSDPALTEPAEKELFRWVKD